VGNGKKHVYLSDSKTNHVLTLSDVLHVPSIRVNLVSVTLLGKVRVKVSFESDQIVMTKNNMLVGNGYCDQGLFILNFYEIVNESSSFVYIVDLYNMWHAIKTHELLICYEITMTRIN